MLSICTLNKWKTAFSRWHRKATLCKTNICHLCLPLKNSDKYIVHESLGLSNNLLMKKDFLKSIFTINILVFLTFTFRIINVRIFWEDFCWKREGQNKYMVTARILVFKLLIYQVTNSELPAL